jgi:hypothetical protein
MVRRTVPGCFPCCGQGTGTGTGTGSGSGAGTSTGTFSTPECCPGTTLPIDVLLHVDTTFAAINGDYRLTWNGSVWQGDPFFYLSGGCGPAIWKFACTPPGEGNPNSSGTVNLFYVDTDLEDSVSCDLSSCDPLLYVCSFTRSVGTGSCFPSWTGTVTVIPA